ncbi:hypothetical protein [Candidatus Venteria ishoeyi]|uniref:Uncharacterized protein n=1 Tax=Candidatus Venteria ishoeyi TaxID=1899563 RepID=A0A1H6F5W7_9GAMM|nr:hypothetical protein [Candidatus Venteria ishoeyi]SEH04679.1 Uncharacterised protein [Candidatus Venteria ishoeyi]
MNKRAIFLLFTISIIVIGGAYNEVQARSVKTELLGKYEPYFNTVNRLRKEHNLSLLISRAKSINENFALGVVRLRAPNSLDAADDAKKLAINFIYSLHRGMYDSEEWYRYSKFLKIEYWISEPLRKEISVKTVTLKLSDTYEKGTFEFQIYFWIPKPRTQEYEDNTGFYQPNAVQNNVHN